MFDTYIEHLSSACASVYNILDPEVLAIGGGLSAAGPFLFDPLQEKVSKKCFYATRGKLVPAVLGNEAGMVGAESVRAGQIVLDVGIHVGADGNLCGDTRFAEVEPIVEAITPVPGGVGAVTTAILASHVIEAARRS